MKKDCQAKKIQTPMLIPASTDLSIHVSCSGRTQTPNQKRRTENNDENGTNKKVRVDTPRPPLRVSNGESVLKPKTINFAVADHTGFSKKEPTKLLLGTPKVKQSFNKENFVETGARFTTRPKESAKMLGLRQKYRTMASKNASCVASERIGQGLTQHSGLCESPVSKLLSDEWTSHKQFRKQMDFIKEQSLMIFDLIEMNSKLEKEMIELKANSKEREFILEKKLETLKVAFTAKIVQLKSCIREKKDLVRVDPFSMLRFSAKKY